jgi:hypothetical protein
LLSQLQKKRFPHLKSFPRGWTPVAPRASLSGRQKEMAPCSDSSFLPIGQKRWKNAAFLLFLKALTLALFFCKKLKTLA